MNNWATRWGLIVEQCQYCTTNINDIHNVFDALVYLSYVIYMTQGMLGKYRLLR